MSSLNEVRDLDSSVRVQHGREPFLLLFALFRGRTRVRRKHARNLRKDADLVHRVDVRNHVAVRVLVLEQERSEVRLPATHHLLYGRDNRRVTNNNGFVETWEQWATGDGEGEDLRVNFRD